MARKKSATRDASAPSNTWENGETTEKPNPASAGQSGDLQGLSDVPNANSESVTELLQDEKLRDRFAQAGRTQVENMHVWPASMKILDDLLSGGSIPEPLAARTS